MQKRWSKSARQEFYKVLTGLYDSCGSQWEDSTWTIETIVLPAWTKPNNGIYNTQNSQQTCA